MITTIKSAGEPISQGAPVVMRGVEGEAVGAGASSVAGLQWAHPLADTGVDDGWFGGMARPLFAVRSIGAVDAAMERLPLRGSDGQPLTAKQVEQMPFTSFVVELTVMLLVRMAVITDAKGDGLIVRTNAEEALLHQQNEALRVQIQQAVAEAAQAHKSGLFGLVLDWVVSSSEVLAGTLKLLGGQAEGVVDVMSGCAGLVKAAGEAAEEAGVEGDGVHDMVNVAGKIQLTCESIGMAMDMVGMARGLMASKQLGKATSETLAQQPELLQAAHAKLLEPQALRVDADALRVNAEGLRVNAEGLRVDSEALHQEDARDLMRAADDGWVPSQHPNIAKLEQRAQDCEQRAQACEQQLASGETMRSLGDGLATEILKHEAAKAIQPWLTKGALPQLGARATPMQQLFSQESVKSLLSTAIERVMKKVDAVRQPWSAELGEQLRKAVAKEIGQATAQGALRSSVHSSANWIKTGIRSVATATTDVARATISRERAELMHEIDLLSACMSYLAQQLQLSEQVKKMEQQSFGESLKGSGKVQQQGVESLQTLGSSLMNVASNTV